MVLFLILINIIDLPENVIKIIKGALNGDKNLRSQQ